MPRRGLREFSDIVPVLSKDALKTLVINCSRDYAGRGPVFIPFFTFQSEPGKFAC